MEKPEQSNSTIVPWNPVWAVAFAIIIYFAASLFGGLILWAGISILPWSDAQATNWLDHSTASQFIYILLVEALSLGAVVLFLKQYRQRWSVIGFKRPQLRDAGIGLLAYPIYFIAFAIVLVLATKFIPGLDIDQEQQLGFDNVQGTLALVMTFVSLVVLPPLVEEIIVRGLIFTSLRKYLKFFGAALVTSLVFAAAHLPEGGASGPLYIAAIDTFMLSMVLCFLREKTGSLWAGITLHALKNGVAFISLFILVGR
ncbi:MAG: rane protein of unknown function [Candidatus Saccharibacteria bacterium]|nr:rane protein of unknown function [Candidatus Saccharibacteria bacterium]